VVRGCVELLGRWRESWDARPEIIVGLPAAGYPLLVGSVVEAIAARGRLPTAGMEVTTSMPTGMSSAEEAAHWRDALTVPGNSARAVTARVVLLVVDATSSRWPVTVATAELRRAGAAAVAPLVLHLRP
jgi:ATP-dependent DNA helicase RecQ